MGLQRMSCRVPDVHLDLASALSIKRSCCRLANKRQDGSAQQDEKSHCWKMTREHGPTFARVCAEYFDSFGAAEIFQQRAFVQPIFDLNFRSEPKGSCGTCRIMDAKVPPLVSDSTAELYLPEISWADRKDRDRSGSRTGDSDALRFVEASFTALLDLVRHLRRGWGGHHPGDFPGLVRSSAEGPLARKPPRMDLSSDAQPDFEAASTPTKAVRFD